MISYTIRPAAAEEVDAITAVEEACFPKAEACERAEFARRLQIFPECFWVAESEGSVIGLINGCVTTEPLLPDELYHSANAHQSTGAWQTVFGLAVIPEYQHQGIASALMEHFISTARCRDKSGVVLTCKEAKIGFYEKFGYMDQGVADSTHGGAEWHLMVLTF